MDNAVENGEKAYATSLKLSDLSLQSAIARKLSDFYSKKKKFEKALEFYAIYNALSDSIDNSAQVKKQVEAQFKFKEENLTYKMERNEQLLLSEEEKSLPKAKKNRITMISFTIFLLMMIFSLLTYLNLQKNRKQKNVIIAQKIMVESQKTEIENQKHLLEEKQKEVMSSIQYALRIQRSQMASEKYIERNLLKLKKRL